MKREIEANALDSQITRKNEKFEEVHAGPNEVVISKQHL